MECFSNTIYGTGNGYLMLCLYVYSISCVNFQTGKQSGIVNKQQNCVFIELETEKCGICVYKSR